MRDEVLRPRLSVEAAGLAVGWYLYRYGRFAVRDQVVEAYDNAHDVLDIEAALGLAVEDEIQAAVISNAAVTDVVNHYYVYAHVTVTIAVLLMTWATAPAAYRRLRRVLVVATLLGLAVHAAYPLAPPRMVPRAGLVDTLARFGPRVYSGDRFDSVVNQFAAMPSFHVGWAALVAVTVVAAYRSPWRWLALGHPTLMTLAVISTANHYVVDAVGGIAIVSLVGLADRILTRSRGRSTTSPSRSRPPVWPRRSRLRRRRERGFASG